MTLSFGLCWCHNSMLAFTMPCSSEQIVIDGVDMVGMQTSHWYKKAPMQCTFRIFCSHHEQLKPESSFRNGWIDHLNHNSLLVIENSSLPSSWSCIYWVELVLQRNLVCCCSTARAFLTFEIMNQKGWLCNQYLEKEAFPKSVPARGIFTPCLLSLTVHLWTQKHQKLKTL